tara:strand:- start:929 stop:1432 length:504 start_codon:yes stop_codon:yes gene_type:complete
MIAERISLIETYRVLTQLETNEGKLYDIVLNRKVDNKTQSPQAFKDLVALRLFINKNYPFMNLDNPEIQICTWMPYLPAKFWVTKQNGTLVEFKSELTTKKSSLNNISKKRLRELSTFINNLQGAISLDDYISPFTASYVECVYIDDIRDQKEYGTVYELYKKYIKI